MANYLNTLTDKPNIWIEENIYNDSELATFDSPVVSSGTTNYTLVIACFQNDSGCFYSLRARETFEDKDFPRWTILNDKLECLKVKDINLKREELLKIIEKHYNK